MGEAQPDESALSVRMGCNVDTPVHCIIQPYRLIEVFVVSSCIDLYLDVSFVHHVFHFNVFDVNVSGWGARVCPSRYSISFVVARAVFIAPHLVAGMKGLWHIMFLFDRIVHVHM